MIAMKSEFQMRLLMEAAQLRIEAAKLLPGRARDALLQRIDKLEQSATVGGRVNSPGFDVRRS